MKLLIGAALVAASAIATVAHAREVYLQGGTQGIGIGYAHPITSWAGVHADINGFGLSRNFSAGNLDYDAHLHLFNAGTYLDLFPFQSSSFRVTAGLLFNDDYLSGNAVSHDGFYKINGTSYFAPTATVSARVKYPTVMPYLGLGFGHKPVTTRGLGFTADIGVAYGRPHVDFNVSPDLVAIAGANNVNAEEQQLRNKADRYRIYPIVQIGMTYRF
ncbi:hypothetical protein [Burkholderia multivorans]|jgi:opacity protein-like surface antigen|uniref:hypothetical protein n=1 Tax=Burkholderia multivorans TaxID=87883 RepID=UPI0021C227E3|nr:hypothetical protein [Burkholderia multivorans]MDR9051062.1 hypothetical protein [Burkholderia multivorans]MDR9060684.1 hypothetical protein [Burkholderia multivorans]MDR9062700.1 hypothetical protein [Burkholderia multivorans]MDR9077679.1 hypothetical protein [Burkholderia multivorans]MDR9093568.1 hypothetical protein [Burkholderia multivorans]